MGSFNSSLCCYCRTQHERCCGVSRTRSEAKRYVKPSEYDTAASYYVRPFHQSQPSPESVFPGHCDDGSVHSYYQEISCFCPSKCHRKKHKKSPKSSCRLDTRSSFTFHDVVPSSSCRQLRHDDSKLHPDSVEDCLHPRSPPNGKSNRSSVHSAAARRGRRASGGQCQKHGQSFRSEPSGRARCPSHRERGRCVPPFPLQLDPCGEREAMTKNHNTYMLSTNSQADMDEWIRVLRRVIRAPPGGGIFGRELSRTIMYEEQVDSKLPTGMRKRREAPYIIETCCEFIRENGGFQEEGLFRLPGQANDVKELQDSFDIGERPSFEKSTDTHTVASLMKSFLRELPEPLVPYDLYTPLIEAAKMANTSNHPIMNATAIATGENNDDQEATRRSRECIKKQLEELPRENFKLLRYLCRFLDEVQQHSKHNKMDIDNLALMFGPNIMRSRKEEPMTMMSHATYVQHIMSEFIRNHEYLFPDDEPGRAPDSSIPDVAADAASRHLRDDVAAVHTSPPTRRIFTDTAVSSRSAQAVSTDGFNTMTTQTTTSPPGTIGMRHITDDSGTGSLGPTPNSTSKRNDAFAPPHQVVAKPTSTMGEGYHNQTVADEVSRNTRPVVPRKPQRTRQPAGSVDIDRRESFYDNVTQSSEGSAPFSVKKRQRNEQPQTQPNQQIDNKHHNRDMDDQGGSGRSSYVNQTSPTSSSMHSSTNAVAGSSVHSLHSFDNPSGSPTMSVNDQQFLHRTHDEMPKGPKPPLRKKRPKKSVTSTGRQSTVSPRSNSRCLSDEESNTESIVQESNRSAMSSRHGSVSSTNDRRFSRDRGGQSGPKRPSVRPPPPPYHDSPARAEDDRSRNSDHGRYHQPPTYEELENDVRILQEKLMRQTGDFEARAKLIEQQLIRQIHDLRSSASCDFARQDWSPRAVSSINGRDSVSCAESEAGAISAAAEYRSMAHTFDVESTTSELKEVGSSEEQVAFLKKCVSEERRLRKMTEIQLRNEQRARTEAEERNEQLQKEMREFFYTFGSMFSNSDTSSVHG